MATQHPDLAPPVKQRAKRAFLSGVTPTIGDAARFAGVSPLTLKPIAAREKWMRKRKEHQERMTERALEKVIETEAELLAQARKLAWTSSIQALTIVAEGMAARKITPTPRDALALGQLALALTGAADPKADAEVARVRALPELEKLKLFVTTFSAQWGTESKPASVTPTNGSNGNGNGSHP